MTGATSSAGSRMIGSLRPREGWIRVIAIALAVASLAVGASLGAGLYRGPLIFVFVLAAAHAACLVLALVWPRAAAIAAVLACFAIPLVAQGVAGLPWPWAITTMITQALVVGIVTHRSGWVVGGVTLVASVAVSGLAAFMAQSVHSQDSIAVNLVVFASLAGGMLAGGIVVSRWQDIRSQLARERKSSEEERARRVIAEEKTRISRELHDVIAHSMSIINVQASSAAARHPGLDQEVGTEFEEIAAASRRALEELRGLLTVLRDEHSVRALAPQPTLSRIPELVEQSGVPGNRTRLTWIGPRSDEGVSELVGLAAYRIVQEALSNVIRHAPSTTADVRFERGAQSLEISVENTAPRHGGPVAVTARPGGQGLLGMSERAESVGGTIEYGWTARGGYRVHARLPLKPPPPEES